MSKRYNLHQGVKSSPLATTHLSIKCSRMGSRVGIIGAISLALDYLFIVENNAHVPSKSKEVVGTYHSIVF
ncbi:MAG TPA: hypothetical protein VJ821_07510 [Anaerolineales bacterium]|nr:hypothetical protein [Anaerolineales bacterium]